MAFRADGVVSSGYTAGSGVDPVVYESKIYDLQDGAPATNYNTATFTFTAPVAGIYRFAANICGSTSEAGTASMQFSMVMLDASSVPVGQPIQQQFISTSATDFEGATIAGDFQMLVGYQLIMRAQNTGTANYAIPAGTVIGRSFVGSLIFQTS